MTFAIDGQFVWDFWTVHDDAKRLHHLFHLHAPMSLGDPEQRHRSARVGHAVSADLKTWTRLPDPLPEAAGYDDLASWTGCTIGSEGAWWLFTTGLSRADDGRVQRIGAATSADLTTWTRTALVLEADPDHYQLSSESWVEEAWRDPWVVRGDDGRWHMYVTARAGTGSGLGVVGHATSSDLTTWTVQRPLSEPTGRFEWLEVIQLVLVEGRWAVLFSCLAEQMPGSADGAGGVWSVPVDGAGSPVDVDRAVRLTSEDLYVGKVWTEADGSTRLLAFQNRGPDGLFTGGVVAPLAVGWNDDGSGLRFTGGEGRWHPPTG